MPWLALRVQVAQASADALSEALLEEGAQSVSIDALAGFAVDSFVDDAHAAASELADDAMARIGRERARQPGKRGLLRGQSAGCRSA